MILRSSEYKTYYKFLILLEQRNSRIDRSSIWRQRSSIGRPRLFQVILRRSEYESLQVHIVSYFLVADSFIPVGLFTGMSSIAFNRLLPPLRAECTLF